MNDISKDKDYQEFFAGIKELAKRLIQIRERAAIEYAPIVEEFCARKHATANEVGRILDYLFEISRNHKLLHHGVQKRISPTTWSMTRWEALYLYRVLYIVRLQEKVHRSTVSTRMSSV